MEVRHLKLVREVADKGSLTKAMDSLFLSQSALSHQLKEVESQLGANLFHRVNKKLVLTGAGKLVLESAERILDDLEKTEISVKKYVNGNKGNIRLSTECYSCYHWLPSLMVDFKKEFPNVEIEIMPEYSLNPMKHILNGELDLAIMSYAEDNPNLNFTPLISDDMVAIVPSNHLWTKRKYVEAKDFEDQQVIIHSYPLETVNLFRDLLTPAGITPKKIIPIQITDAAMEMIRAGMGLQVLARWIVEPYLSDKRLAAVPITKKGMTRTWYTVTLKNGPQYLNNFISHLGNNIDGTCSVS